MAKEKFDRTKPHVNVGTIGHVDHGKTTLILPPGRFSPQVSPESEAQADLQRLLALQPQRGTPTPTGDVSNQPEFINTPGATAYRTALNETITKYGSVENFARLIGATPPPDSEPVPEPPAAPAAETGALGGPLFDLTAAKERFPAEEVPVGRGAPAILPLDPPAERQTITGAQPGGGVVVPPFPPPITVGPAPNVGTLPPDEAVPIPSPAPFPEPPGLTPQ